MEILLYIGKVSLYWVLFYTCYLLFLRQQTFFTWNRLYLLGALIVSFALPFVIYPESAPELPVIYEVSAAAFSVNYVQPEQVTLFTWTNAAIFLYLLAVLFRLFKVADNLRQLKRFIIEGEMVELEDCKVALINSNEVGSFSFLKWIVVNRNDYENHFDAILRHEMVHTSQGHSFDILFVEILRSIFWFNPVLIWYKNSLQEVHEYLADEAAPNREHYANFLVSYALNAPIAALTNHFFKPSQIHSRIKMIYKNRSSKWLRSSYILTIGFIGTVALLIAGCEKIKRNFSETSTTIPGQKTDSTKSIKVEGWITSAADKSAIPGASIVVEGMQLGTTTDSDGKFTILAPSHSRLVISFLGFKTQIRPINGISSHLISLSPGTTSDTEATSESQETEPPAHVDEVKIQTLEVHSEAKVFTVVEKQPRFPGGLKEMYKFLGENVRYPEAASKARVSGRVFISFIVTASGKIKDITILKGIGFGCDAEAVRVVSSFPKWEPGMQDGKPVDVKYNLPILFSIDDESNAEISASDKDASAGINNATTIYRQPSPSIAIKEDEMAWSKEHQPLYVVDGETANYTDAKAMLAQLPPAKIESISVLKGASASAIYGEKGTHGVVVIKTSNASTIAK